MAANLETENVPVVDEGENRLARPKKLTQVGFDERATLNRENSAPNRWNLEVVRSRNAWNR